MTVRTLLCALVATVLTALTAQAAPKIKVTELDFNFGKMPQHAVGTHRFWIKSVGDSKVKVTKAEPDCGCTTIILKDSVIAPGDSVPIDVVFHSRSFIGYIVKRPSIEIQGSTEKTLIKFLAEVITDPTRTSPLVINPAKVDVSQFTEKPRRKATFTIVNNTAHDYTIAVVDSILKSFAVKLPADIKAGQQISGEVTVKKEALATSFEEAFTFELNDAGHTRYSVPVNRLYNPRNDPATPLSGGE